MGIISEASPDFEAKASPAEKRAVELALQAAKTSTGDLARQAGINQEVLATYKIEIYFSHERRSADPNKVVVSVWESGKRFDGGGDESMFWCRDGRKGGTEGCGGIIPNKNVNSKNGMALCPHCNRVVNSQVLPIFRPMEKSHKDLAKALVKLFHHLRSDADIYLKFAKTDPRYKAMERAYGAIYAAKHKGLAIYPLKNIIRDTGNGGDLAKRFEAFLTA